MSTPPQQTKQSPDKAIIPQGPINGIALKKLTSAGLAWLRTNQEIVNALNVFPVPDGDTGTNMVLTMQSAYDEIADSPEKHVGEMAQDFAHGALMGARGNSGVILSQIWRGFSRALEGIDILDGAALARAFDLAQETAYKGVVRPVEGTILTVCKDMAAATQEFLAETDDPLAILEHAVKEADASVKRTPELLDVLKEAGVVDSGGKGLFFIFEGMLRYAQGLPLDTALISVKPLASLNLDGAMQVVEPGQDYEIVVDFRPHKPLELESFYSDLEEMGTSIQIGEGDGMYRMHIHVPTEKRYEPIDYTMSIGTITKVHIENLLAQMDEIERERKGQQLQLAPPTPGEIAIVAVSPGPGIARVFASLGVSSVIEGGQTMNPSTQEMLAAFENLPTDKIIILPNNKNIFMASQAAADVTVKKAVVIPSRTVPQGLSALLNFVPDGDFDSVVTSMQSALEDVETGEVTTATRSVEIDGVTVQEGEIIALHNGKLVLSTDKLEKACLDLLEIIGTEEYELITLFYGVDIDKPSVNHIVDVIRAAYPDQEVEVQDGGQPHYQFILSVE
ncbi:MAG: DAK2 domain-containing protein [Chloroflexi bacterium]|nr:DAK2 domain-containing protein [Chloroflexota bacterium]